MTLKERFSYCVLLIAGLALTVAFGIWWFEPSHIAQNFHGVLHIFDYVLFIVLTYIVWHEILMEAFAWYIAASVKHPTHMVPPVSGLRVAYVTAFVPGSEPYSLLEKTLSAMVQVEYPHDTWLLDEGDDPIAQDICHRYGVKHYSRKGKEHLNTVGGRFAKKTKGGNYNSWLHHHDAEYDIVAQHDVDFIPSKDYLTPNARLFPRPRNRVCRHAAGL